MNNSTHPPRPRLFRQAIIPALGFLMGVQSAQAGFFVSKGQTGAGFLTIPLSSRLIALGNSFSAGFGDLASMETNPAGIVGLHRNELNGSYQAYFDDASLQSLSFGVPVSLGIKPAEGTTPFIPRDKLFLGFHYRQFKVNDDAQSIAGLSQGVITLRDQAIQMGLGYAPFDQVAFGLSGKWISRRINSYSQSSYAADVGAIIFLSETLTAGLSVLNMGPDSKFLESDEPLPTTGRLGLKWDATSRLSFLTDLSEVRDRTLRQSAGAEIKAASFARFRLGVSHGTDLEYTGGFGVQFAAPKSASTSTKNDALATLDTNPGAVFAQSKPVTPSQPIQFGLDYAARVHTELGVTHTMTLKILF